MPPALPSGGRRFTTGDRQRTAADAGARPGSCGSHTQCNSQFIYWLWISCKPYEIQEPEVNSSQLNIWSNMVIRLLATRLHAGDPNLRPSN